MTIPALEATYPAGRYLVDHPAATVALSAIIWFSGEEQGTVRLDVLREPD